MNVVPTALARLRESPMRGEGVATIFEAMAFGMAQTNTPCSMFTLDFQHPDDVVEPGQLIPVITLSLRPVVAQSREQ